ncbi:hypothetical protein CEV33_1419 [Brucella grignonensis]|uniref:Uncharacterized protein n=1 Tax=Brucella grignonensis TaxID=94627 RepID=A0A256FAX8_9HYPH|nr:hypothetical protein CEV33_1419 [Brucella grignonensis]
MHSLPILADTELINWHRDFLMEKVELPDISGAAAFMEKLPVSFT